MNKLKENGDGKKSFVGDGNDLKFEIFFVTWVKFFFFYANRPFNDKLDHRALFN